jgi:hypothetical protein
MNPNKALWEKGDFTRIAESMRESGDELVARIGVTQGEKVLDGDGTEFVDAFRRYYGPTMNAFEAAEKNGRASNLQKELESLFESQNQSPRKDLTSISATFLRVARQFS